MMQLWRVPTLIQHPLNDTRSGQTSAPQIPQEDIQTELSSIVTHHFAALKPTLRKESHMMPRKLGARISCRAKVLRAYLSHTLQAQFCLQKKLILRFRFNDFGAEKQLQTNSKACSQSARGVRVQQT
jgi:hypothetical protein